MCVLANYSIEFGWLPQIFPSLSAVIPDLCKEEDLKVCSTESKARAKPQLRQAIDG